MLTSGLAEVVDHPHIKHAWGSTTALYTGVSTDFKNRVLRASLDRAFGPQGGVE